MAPETFARSGRDRRRFSCGVSFSRDLADFAVTRSPIPISGRAGLESLGFAGAIDQFVFGLQPVAERAAGVAGAFKVNFVGAHLDVFKRRHAQKAGQGFTAVDFPCFVLAHGTDPLFPGSRFGEPDAEASYRRIGRRPGDA